jgi:5-methylcytosine-specific restriction endonuclease McrA
MTRLAKNAPSRMDGGAYRQLRARVLQRDGWRCQECGSRTNVEVHHCQFRSRHGDDAEKNLVARLVSGSAGLGDSNPCRQT